MGNVRTISVFRALACALVITLSAALLAPATASAHAEMRQSSPQAGETVGGAIHSIALQFLDLDLRQPVSVKAFGPDGEELDAQLNNEDQRLVLALVDPINSPGEYLVTYDVWGVDGDFVQESFTFIWQEGAPEPSGIDVDLSVPQRLDTLSYVLILIGAALAAFVVHRFVQALREHRAAMMQE